MKNRILWLLVLGMAFFVGCSDDDDDLFKNFSANYSADKLDLKLNGKSFPGATVSFNAADKSNAKLTLNGVIPGESALEISNLIIAELENDDFSFIGENKNDDRTITVEGAVKSGVLNLGTTFKVTSKVVGEWVLAETKMNEEDMSMISSPLYLNIDTDLESMTLPLMMFSGNYDPENNTPIYDTPLKLSMKNNPEEEFPGFPVFIQNIFGMLVPGLLQSIELREDGNLIATYMPMTGLMSGEEANEPLVTEEGLVRYNVINNEIYLLIDIASMMTPRSTGNNTDIISSMLTTGIPLKLVVDENNLRAYVDKNMIMPFLTFADLAKGAVADMEPLNVLIGEVTPAALQKFIDDIVDLISNSRTFELGLDLVPYVEIDEVTPAAYSISRNVEGFMQKYVK